MMHVKTWKTKEYTYIDTLEVFTFEWILMELHNNTAYSSKPRTRLYVRL